MNEIMRFYVFKDTEEKENGKDSGKDKEFKSKHREG